MDTFFGVLISSSAVMISTSKSSPAESITQIPPTPCFQMCCVALNRWQMMLFQFCMIIDSKESTLISPNINMLLSFLWERPVVLRDGVCFLSLGTCFLPDVALLKPVLAGTPGMTQALPHSPSKTLKRPCICVLSSFCLHRHFSWRAGRDPQPPSSHAVLLRCRRDAVLPWEQHKAAVGCRVGHHAGVMLITLVCFIAQPFSLLLLSWCWYNNHCYVDPWSSNSLYCCMHSSVQICSLARKPFHLHLSMKQGNTKTYIFCTWTVKLRSCRKWRAIH